jgi:hypothetical protein
VAGGTFPALIWKEFMSNALVLLNDRPESFPAAPLLSVQERRVVYRNGSWKLANAFCRSSEPVVYFSGRGPAKDAGCKPNEVSVPSVVGYSLESVSARLALQPLESKAIYVAAAARSRPGLVVRQLPARGALSAHDTVTLVVTKAAHGLVPDLVGSALVDARPQLAKLALRVKVTLAKGQPGTILRQSVPAGVAAWPGMRIRLVVGR